MIPCISRVRRGVSAFTVSCGLAVCFGGPQALFPAVATAQSPPPVAPAADSAATAAAAGNTPAPEGGRRLAPHDTFFLLNYVAAKTADGVDGFVPGQEVHLVAVHRATHTLVVTDGRTDVEVSPSQLTNDLDIAALVRQRDRANQARIADYVQKQEAAYAKQERTEAEQAAKDDERHKLAEAAEVRAVVQARATPTPQPVEASVGTGGFYGVGGEGYGSPYSYLSDGAVVVQSNGNGAGRGVLPSNQAGSGGREPGPGAGVTFGAGDAHGGAAAGGAGGAHGGGGGKP